MLLVTSKITLELVSSFFTALYFIMNQELIIRTDSNVFGLSNFTIACILELTTNVVMAFAAVFAALLENNGVSANQLLFITSTCSLLFAIGFDFYRYKFNHQNFFILFDIWKPEQRRKWFSISYIFPLFIFNVTIEYFGAFLSILSFGLANNVADVECIAAASVIFLPLVAVSNCCLCSCCIDVPFKKAIKGDWKHRYVLCLILITIGCILVAQPGFIFGYSNSVNPYDQGLAVICSIISALLIVLSIIAATLIKKLILLDFLKDPDNVEITQQILDNLQTLDLATLGSIKVKDNEYDSNCNPPTLDASTPLLSNSGSKESDHDEEGKDLDQEGGRNINMINSTQLPLSAADLTIENVAIIIDNVKTTPQSNKFILQNDTSLALLGMEYGKLTMVMSSALFSLLYVAFDNTKYSSFGDNFDTFSSSAVSAALNDENIGYTIGSICLTISTPLFTALTMIKMPNALFIGVFNVCQTIFSFIISYFLQSSNTNVYEVVGIISVCLAILISVYPWNKLPNIPKSF